MKETSIFFVNFQKLKEMLNIKQKVLHFAKEARFNDVVKMLKELLATHSEEFMMEKIFQLDAHH